GEEFAAFGRDLVLVLAHALAPLRAGPRPRTEPLHVGLARFRALTKLRDAALACLRHLVLVLLQAGRDPSFPGLDTRAELLRVVHAGMLRGLRQQKRQE